MELYKRAEKLGIPDIHITEEDWQKNYNNSYSVLALNGSDMDKILAAQDIIKTYLVLQAEAIQPAIVPNTESDICEHGFMRGNCWVETCPFIEYRKSE